MTCDECRAVLASGEPLSLLDTPAVREHCSACPDCARSATLIMEGHREAVRLFLDARSALTDPQLIERAVASAERRQRGRLVFLLIAVVLIPLATIVGIQAARRAAQDVAKAVQSDQVVETIPLACLAPERAGDLVSAYLRSNGSIYYAGKPPLHVITIRGTPAEVQRSRELIAQYDRAGSGACVVPTPPVVQPPATGGAPR